MQAAFHQKDAVFLLQKKISLVSENYIIISKKVLIENVLHQLSYHPIRFKWCLSVQPSFENKVDVVEERQKVSGTVTDQACQNVRGD